MESGHHPIGVAITALVDPRLASASGGAFALSETVDLAVYTRLQCCSLPFAVLVSAFVGDVLDSTAFLAPAGIPFAIAWPGQLGKAWAIVLATLILIMYRRRLQMAPV